MMIERRYLLAVAIIVISFCAGFYKAVVEPARIRVADARSVGAELARQLKDAEAIRDRIPELAAELEELAAAVRFFEAQGELTREEQRLFSALMSAAEVHQMRIDQLTPQRAVAKGDGTEQSKLHDVSIGYTITAAGTYDDTLRFVRALSTELGFATIRSATLRTRRGDPPNEVRVQIETQHFHFDTKPESLHKAQSARTSAGGER